METASTLSEALSLCYVCGGSDALVKGAVHLTCTGLRFGLCRLCIDVIEVFRSGKSVRGALSHIREERREDILNAISGETLRGSWDADIRRLFNQRWA